MDARLGAVVSCVTSSSAVAWDATSIVTPVRVTPELTFSFATKSRTKTVPGAAAVKAADAAAAVPPAQPDNCPNFSSILCVVLPLLSSATCHAPPAAVPAPRSSGRAHSVQASGSAHR